MEGDCKDKSSPSAIKSDADSDITQLFRLLSQQITQLSTQNMNIQDQLHENEHVMVTRLQTVVQENDPFQQSMRTEIDDLRRLLATQSQPNSSPSQVPSAVPVPPVSHASAPMTSNLSGNIGVLNQSLPTTPALAVGSPSVSISPDTQANMLLLLAESFTKLTSALSEKSDSKSSDWPKFSGDQRKFRAWYLSILSQLSIPPWEELYDSGRNDVVVTTSNVSLNEKLYAKLIISLEGQVLQDIITRPHLRADGVFLHQELVQTYCPKHVPEVLAAKAGEFRSQTKRQPNESVDSYYNRFQELLEELSHADDQISTKSAMRHFIFTLGPKFEPIQNNYRIGCLPSNWQTTHWPSLSVLWRDFFHSVNPKGLSSVSITGNHTLSTADRNAQHKKVKKLL